MDVILDQLKSKKPDPETLKRALSDIDESEIVKLIDNTDISKASLKLILDFATEFQWKYVLLRLSSQEDFGILIAKEVFSKESISKLEELKVKHNLESGDRVRSYGRLFSDKKALFWLFGILFSKRFASALTYLVHDSTKKIRGLAITSLASFDGYDVKQQLISAFDDSDGGNATLAKKAFAEKYGNEELQKVLETNKLEESVITQKAAAAKESLNNVFDAINPSDKIKEWTSSIIDTGQVAFNSVSQSSGELKTKVSEKMSGLFRKKGVSDEMDS